MLIGSNNEHDSGELVLKIILFYFLKIKRYFLQEWKLVKSHLDDIIVNCLVADPSAVNKIRSIVNSE